MFAGEGGPERTNRRFHYVSRGLPAKRLSTAFDSVTLYGEDPDHAPGHLRQGRQLRRLDRQRRRRQEALLRLRPRRPDDVGVDDHQRPGADAARLLPERRHRPAVREVHPRARAWSTRSSRRSTRSTRRAACRGRATRARCPTGNDGLGLLLLGVTGDEVLPREVYEQDQGRRRCQQVRGTVQADILKEDQAQNTCIFSTEFALRLMGDMQQYFIDQQVRNFYSVSISRLPHRRSRREPDLAARLHAGQRLHLRRVLPVARHEHRRLRAQPVVLLLERHGPGVRGDRPGGAPHLGQGHHATSTAATSARRSSSTTSRPRAVRCTRRRSPSTTSAPRCRRCSRSTTTATRCTPTPTTRPSPRRPRRACAARWPSS